MELGLSLGEAAAGSPVPPQTRAFFQLESKEGRDWRLDFCMGVGLHSPAGKGGDAGDGEEEATRMIISWKDEILKEEEETEERRSSPADPALQLDLLPLSPTSVPMRHRDDDHPPRLLERASSRASDEEESGGLGRKKLRLSKEQSAYLEESFKEHNTLTPKQKLALAKQLNLRTRQVEVWFQNRRARTKLKQTEVDCEHLRRWCERLTEENRRLHKELQELRVLKASDPSYLHVPPTTLTMCPSCERLASATAAAHQHHQQQYHYQSSSDRLQLQLQLRSTQHHFCSPISTESRKRQQPSAAS